jgi:hypothetical protein
MLVLFETPAGHALFQLLDAGKLKKPDDLRECFESADKTRKLCAQPSGSRLRLSFLSMAELMGCWHRHLHAGRHSAAHRTASPTHAPRSV